MRVPFLALLLSLGTIFAQQSQIQAQAADQESPVSIDRIRAGLKRPPPLQIAAPSGDMPTFRVEVRASPFVLQPIEEKAFDPTFGLPSVGELLTPQTFLSPPFRSKPRRAPGREPGREEDPPPPLFLSPRSGGPQAAEWPV